jgi:transcriptional regulator with XRE-family HTH domain
VKLKSPRTDHQRRGQRRARAIRHDLGAEITALRESSGLSMRALALAAGISPSTERAIEGGTHSPSIEVLARVAQVLGAGLGVRLYAGTGPRIYDHLQAPMLQALLHILHPRWTRRLEVPVYGQARGIIDLVLEDASEPMVVACEAQSQLRRLEQQVRWASMKADALAEAHHPADGVGAAAAGCGAVSRLLLLRSTQATRHVVTEFAELLAVAYPARYVDLLAAITGNAPWPGPGLVWCTVQSEGVRILDRPPRGIRLGR